MAGISYLYGLMDGGGVGVEAVTTLVAVGFIVPSRRAFVTLGMS